jgi:hypothetical protein
VPTFGFAVSAELGGTLGTPLALTLAPPEPDDPDLAKDRLPVTGTSLGELSQIRSYGRLVLALLF